MTDTPLLIHRDGAVVELTLNRPDKLNAMNGALVAALTETVAELSKDDSVRAIILTGGGRAFSCGVDLKEIGAGAEAKEGFIWHGPTSLFDVVASCPHPIVTAVNGYAITGGLELAMLGDFLIASDTAVFADTHARVGITPSWGMTQILPRLVGINRARQMSLTGEFVDAQKACDWGLVNEVTTPEDLMPRARALATQIAETDRTTMTRIRGLIGDSAKYTLTDALAREVAVFDTHMAGVSAEDIVAGRERVVARGKKLAGAKG